MKIAILGTRGIPNNYGGFEQCAEHLSVSLVANGYDVTVYSVQSHPYQGTSFKEVKIIKKWCPENKIGSAAHFIYDFICLKDALKKKFDVIFELGYQSVAISYAFLLIKKKSIIVTNMDGLEWKRAKWSPFVKTLTKWFEAIAARKSTVLISDNKGIQDYLKLKYKKDSVMIPYGADKVNPSNELLAIYKVKSHSYFLLIARLEPENNIEMVLDGFLMSTSMLVFLVVGNFETKYGNFLKEKYNSSRVVFLGSIFKKDHLDSLRKFSKGYFHGHSVGGTNPALLEAMAAEALIIAHNNVFNRDVLGQDAFFFKNSNEVQTIINSFDIMELQKQKMIKKNNHKIENIYSHQEITRKYIKLIEKLAL